MNETRKQVMLSDIETCNYWLDKYEAAGNSFAFDEWYVKRENLIKELRRLNGQA